MGLAEIILIALGLSADAFAVSIANSMCIKNMKFWQGFSIAFVFGIFQGVMPVIGYALGNTFAGAIEKYDHVIALVLLGIIGVKMIHDGLNITDNDHDINIKDLTFGLLLVQGVATSIDAMAIGVSFSALKVSIVSSAAIIALVTFVVCIIGIRLGKRIAKFLGNKVEIIGGVILILIGLKIFVQHALNSIY